MDVKLNDVRLAFANLWKAKEFKTGDGKPRFDAVFLIEPGSENDRLIREAIAAEAKAVFADKAAANIKAWSGNSNKFAYQPGTEKYDGFEGKMALGSHNKIRPTVIDANLAPLVEADGRPYSGCYVNAIVSIWAQNGENQGIRAAVLGVQFLRHGESFGGSRAASIDEFDNVSGSVDEALDF